MIFTPSPWGPRRDPRPILAHALRGCLLTGLLGLCACGGGEPVEAGTEGDASVDAAGGEVELATPGRGDGRSDGGTDVGNAGGSEFVSPGNSNGGSTAAVDTSALGVPMVNEAPFIEVDEADHSFGDVYEGEILSHTFKLRNGGNADLMISRIKPSCGCTVGQLRVRAEGGDWVDYAFNEPIAAGSEFELEASLDTKNKHDQASSSIRIWSNDAREAVPLSVHAKVTPYFVANPASLNFGGISVADEVTQTFEVTSRQEGTFVMSVDNKQLPVGLHVDIEPIDPADDGTAARWKASVTIGPDSRVGPLGYPVKLKSNLEVEGAPPQINGDVTYYTTTVHVNAQIKGLIHHQPQFLSLGILAQGQTTSRTVRVENTDPDFQMGIPTVRIDDVSGIGKPSPLAEYFSTSARQVDAEGRVVEIELSLLGFPADISGAVQGKLVIEVGHPSHNEVSALFSGIVSASKAGPAPAGAGPSSRQGPR